MNKHTYQKILWVAGALAALVLFIESFMYYDDIDVNPVIQVVAALHNTLRSFLLDPAISIPDAAEDLARKGGALRQIFSSAYMVGSFVAPLCTATALLLVLERLFLGIVKRIKARKREHLLVFGYNSDVMLLVRNTYAQKKEQYPVIHLVSDTAISEAEEMELLKEGVFFHCADCLAGSDEEFGDLMRLVRAEKTHKIFLMEPSSIRNISLYMLLHKKNEEARAKGKPLFAGDAVCCCQCEEDHSRVLAIDFHDREKQGHKEGEQGLGLYLFDLAEMRVRKSFDYHPLVEQIDLTAKNPYDVHVLIVGFGRMGEQTLRQCANRGVLHSASRIVIDVVDQQAAAKKDRFASIFAPGQTKMTETTVKIGDPQADGELLIRFHDINIHTEQFSRFLQESAAEMPYTYAAVCIRDTDAAVHCLSSIRRFAHTGQDFPIAVKLESSDYLAAYLDSDGATFQTVFSMGGNLSADVLDFDDIFDERMEKKARRYHEIYTTFGLCSAKDYRGEDHPAPSGKPWEQVVFYKQQANRLLSQHAQSRRAILRALTDGDVPTFLRAELEKVGIRLQENGLCVYDLTEQQLLDNINAAPVLGELLKMEHRRWCYAMLFAGWSGDGAKKDEKKQINPCIVTWDALCKGAQYDLAKYDMLPLVMICGGGEIVE